jgi:hypothetical protein
MRLSRNSGVGSSWATDQSAQLRASCIILIEKTPPLGPRKADAMNKGRAPRVEIGEGMLAAAAGTIRSTIASGIVVA